MNTLKDFVIYLFEKYPNPSELSKSRLVKMLYLADWKFALNNDYQLTKIEWFYNDYGPYVDDIINLVKSDSENFRVEIKNDVSGSSREVVYLLPVHASPTVDNSAQCVLDFVIKITYPLHWDKLVQLIYSTYPIYTSHKRSYLDLVSLARDYRGKGRYKAQELIVK